MLVWVMDEVVVVVSAGHVCSTRGSGICLAQLTRYG